MIKEFSLLSVIPPYQDVCIAYTIPLNEAFGPTSVAVEWHPLDPHKLRQFLQIMLIMPFLCSYLGTMSYSYTDCRVLGRAISVLRHVDHTSDAVSSLAQCITCQKFVS